MLGRLRKVSLFPPMKKIIKIVLLVFVLVFLVVLFFLRDYLTFENLKLYKNFIVDYASVHYFLAVAVFFLTSPVWVNSPIPLVLVVSIASGLLFGAICGAFFNIAAVAIGSSVGFWLARYLFHDSLNSRYSRLVQRANNEVIKDGFYYFLALRAALICPYFLINILGGLSKVEYRKFLISTVFGFTLGAIIYSYSGSVIGTINSPHDLFGWKAVTAIVLFVLFSLTPLWTKAYKKLTS